MREEKFQLSTAEFIMSKIKDAAVGSPHQYTLGRASPILLGARDCYQRRRASGFIIGSGFARVRVADRVRVTKSNGRYG